MTASEIRKLNKILEEHGPDDSFGMQIHIEIAAQLAELNEFLRDSFKEVVSNGCIDVANRGPR